MAKATAAQKRLYFGVLGGVTLAWVLGVLAQDLSAPPLTLLVRVLALTGYFGIFVAILSSAYLRELVQTFGQPFIKLHHLVSIVGLVAIGLHPISVAIDYATASVFVPDFSSVMNFLTNGGRLAIYLLALAVVVAIWRKAVGERWRVVHILSYVAFWLGGLHANLLGGNFQNPILHIISLLMALAVVAVFVVRRVRAARKPAKKR
jgi:predicted ferric reductase